MFDVFYSGPKPGLFEFEQPALSLEHAATLTRTGFYWYIYGDNDYSNFDFDYVPVPWENTHIHVWPTPWHQYGGAYLAHQDSVHLQQWHFHNLVVPIRPAPELFTTLHLVDKFDYSWRPHPMDPPFIYVFGNQWYSPERMPTIEYHVPGATERKYLYEPFATLSPTKENWQINSDVPLDFDYSWCPDPHDPAYIYVFGNQHWSGEHSATVEYHVPGATERKYVDTVRAELGVLDIFFVDHGNDAAQTRYELLRGKYPTVTKVRYANSILDTVARCSRRATTARFWVVSSEYDYTDFDFAWQPEPWQHSLTHVFPSQHQKWSNTFLFSRWEFERHVTWAKSLEEFPNLNFVTNQTVRKPDNLYNVYYVDHGNPTSQHQYEYLRADVVKNADIIKTRFVDNYLDTFKRIMATATTEYVWIINGICDYSQFDFTWEPEPWQREMIHVFPSGNQRRGDTFYIHVESFKQQMVDLELLDWFNVINYCDDQAVERFNMPTHHYESDDLITEIKRYNFGFPYAVFTTQKDLQLADSPCMWAKKDRAVIRVSEAGATAIVPRDIQADLRTQIYDYPYIEETKPRLNDYLGGQFDLDIVYISNGEPDEQRWYENLSYMSNTSNIEWVRGVNGRVAAYQEAARRSRTPWFFAVFAKLEVLGNEFNWHWKPDYFQGPKHYIFNSRNPVNGLEYGHQGIIAYNKRLVLENNSPGIDFTLSQPHESVPMLSGVAHFNQSAWMTWRTAFREVIKLKHFMATEPTLETEHRLNVWCTVAKGDYAEYCLAGARDAVAYYTEVGGDYNQLKLSFEWDWLQQRFNAKNVP
jgi:hypothetical protein